MRKFLLFLVLFFGLYFNISFADSESFTGYTLIDCIEGNDNSGGVFDSTKPYQSLKAWIEETINYINKNINKSWNIEEASGKEFYIKVNCSANDLLNSDVKLNFDWKTYDNELIIEGVWDNGMVIQDMYFDIPNNTGQITFKNVKFLDNSRFWYYFKLPDYKIYSKYSSGKQASLYNFYGIKFIDSYIKLYANTNLWTDNSFRINSSNCDSYSRRCYYNNYSFYFNQVVINNSVLEIDIEGDYNYKMPFLVKDSMLNFINTWTWTYDISFIDKSNTSSAYNYWHAVMMSNLIDLWWNNFKTQDKTNISFINNRFSNFLDFNFLGSSIFINNTIENEQKIDISDSKNLINNVFKTWFTDTYDIHNLRKNYALENIWNKWIGWFFKIKSSLRYFDLKTSTSTLYKEITGRDLPENRDWVYVIYNK